MEKGQQYSFTREPTLREVTANSCQSPTSLQWTTSSSHRTPETAWSLSPFSYVHSNRPCLCLRYRNVEECCTSEIKTNPPSLESNEFEEPPKQQEASLSISKDLKFGIERILTQSCKEENSFDSRDIVNRTSSAKSPNKPSTAAKSRHKNGTRSVFSHVQRNILELHYQQREYVTKGERYHIAMATGISEEQVKIWFQNRRTKKKKLERNKMATSEKTKSEHCSLNIMNFH